MLTDDPDVRDALAPLRAVVPTDREVEDVLHRAAAPAARTGRKARLVAPVAVAVALSVLVVAAALLALGRSPDARAGSPLAAFRALASTAPVAATASDVRPALERVARVQPQIMGGNARLVGSVAAGRIVLFGGRDGEVCLALLARAGTAQSVCEAPDRAGRAGVAFGGPVLRFGVVPDGVERIRFTLRSGAEQTVAVEHNVYVAPDEAVKVTFERAGAEQVREFVPRSTAPAVGRTATDDRGVSTRVEPDGSGAVAGPGVAMP
ncbi:hypothetical protein [Patulibacter sp. SYSU D01012]|uniref:hypothetical protein n=1 Tax=Patulibacter sp. SYSU D01012 TaxID=2817381 RepID=UPI001B30FC36|nr:hypothetical protein [Patulibacter sp. SYSU D01012]